MNWEMSYRIKYFGCYLYYGSSSKATIILLKILLSYSNKYILISFFLSLSYYRLAVFTIIALPISISPKNCHAE